MNIQIRDLEKKANAIRQSIIEMLVEAGSGHTAGPLGMSDVFTALYFYSLNHNPRTLPGKIAIDWCFQMATFVRCFMPPWLMSAIFR
jgi:transketolase N-terminal domain/subunit